MKVVECLLVQVLGVLVFCWLCEAAAGGCSRYGHACWGGHGKRSSHPAKVLPLHGLQIGDVRDVDMDTVETSEAAQDADDGDVPQAEALDAGGGRAYRVGGYGLNSVGDLIPIPSEQMLQSPDTTDESEEEVRRVRPQIRHRRKNRDKDVQVLIIPDEESQIPDLHVYQILGHAPRKRV